MEIVLSSPHVQTIVIYSALFGVAIGWTLFHKRPLHIHTHTHTHQHDFWQSEESTEDETSDVSGYSQE